ncbi:MAG: hypothetical protein N2319_08255 [Candidatus Kapabacteria bacterium]|nr:hypothetical protein [Candidatus Kapabacteria bacterium]
MHSLLVDKAKEVLELLNKSRAENNKFIFFISGQFGVGKTELIENLAENNLSNFYSDIVIKFSHNQQYYFFPDFLKNASISLIEDYNSKKIGFDELNYFYDTFYTNFTHLKSLNEDIYNNYINLNKLKSIPEFVISEKQSDDLKNQVNDFICQNIEKKGYQRILLNYFEVATETLIMDLLSIFFLSSDNSDLKDIQIGGEKKNITLIFDNYDRVAGTINQWLFEYLIEYFLNKKFSDFISYSINFENSDIKVSDLFDINIIISGRYLKKKYIDALKPIVRENSELIELNNFTESSLKTYLEEEHKEISDKSNEIFEYSRGFPSIVFFITKHYSRFKKIPDKNDILNFAIHQIFLYTPEKFRQCVISAYFVERFEKTFFRCFDETKDCVDICFEFVKNSTDFFDTNNHILETNQSLSNFIKEYISFNFSHSYENYQTVSKIYSECFDILKPFSYEEIKILRSLAYLKNIDLEFTLREIYQDDAEKVLSFIKNHNDLFEKNNNLFNLKETIRSRLDELNKIIDGENYLLKIETIENSLKKLVSNLVEEKREKKILISSLETDIKIIEDCISSDKTNFETTQKSFIEKENELIELRKQLNIFTNNRHYTNSALNFFFALFVALLSYFFPDIFSSPENHSSLFMVQSILYFIAIVFGVLSIYSLYQGLLLASKNKQKFEVNTKLINAEQERANLQEQMTRLKENQELNKNLLTEKKEQLELLKKRLIDINKFLNPEKSN